VYCTVMIYQRHPLTQAFRASLFWIVLLTAVLNSQAQGAQSDWNESAYKNWTVRSVTIEGMDKEMAEELKKGLALARPEGLLRTRRPPYFPQTLDEDIRRSLLFLARRGYPYATIKYRFIPFPRRKRIELILDVHMGTAVRIADLTVTGIPPNIEKDAGETLSIEVNAIVVDKIIEESRTALTSLLIEKGYARAIVESKVEWKDSNHVTVQFNAQPGVEYYFGGVVITGATEDVIPLIKKVVSIDRGKRFEPKVLDDSQKNLRVLDLFKRIRLDVKEAAPDTLDCTVDVLMKESYRLETAFRYWTDEKLDGSILWKHRNLFKRGRGGSVLAAASFIRQKFELNAWWPAIIFARSRGTVTLGIENETEESYNLFSYGATFGINYDFSLKTRMRVAIAFTNIDVDEKAPLDDEIETQDGTLNSLQCRWERNAGNHPIGRTWGTYTYLDVEWAPDGPLNDYRFISIAPTGVIYVPLAPSHKWVLASRVTVGAGWPIGQSIDLLPNKRFYSGGASSMRGFHRRKLGPLAIDESPLGGEAKLEVASELRFPLFSRFGGTWFVDSGQVWFDLDDIDFEEYEVATGLGLWINTVIGPIRGDLAYRLTYYEKSQPRWVFHFSIGPAF